MTESSAPLGRDADAAHAGEGRAPAEPGDGDAAAAAHRLAAACSEVAAAATAAASGSGSLQQSSRPSTAERQAALLAAIPDLWFVLDAQSRYVEVSDPAHAALAGPWAERQGRCVADVLGPEHAARVRQQITQAHASGQPQSAHYRMVVRSGERRHFEGRCMPLANGHSLMLVRDVTQNVQLEQGLRAMADAAPIGIFMIDVHGRMSYTNRAWQQLVGMDAEAALGHGWSDAVHPDDRQRVLQAGAAANQARADFDSEFRVRDGRGRWRTVLGHSGPILGADGTVLGQVGTVVDVTGQRELESTRRAHAVAQEAGRRQSEFMSRMSHELRTPLNAILGFGQLLQQLPAGDGRMPQYAAHVVGAGRQLLRLVEDLLELQRLEQGRLAVAPTDVDVSALLLDVAALLGPLADAAGAHLRVQAAPGLVLRSDIGCLRQMLLNLGSNALRHGAAPDGRSEVLLAAERSSSGVLLRVADNGAGMTAPQLQRLFQPFERLGQAGDAAAGSGLGLVITRQLAQRLGGELRLESVATRGTTALLRLPLEMPASDDPDAPVAPDGT